MATAYKALWAVIEGVPTTLVWREILVVSGW
jgi:hypothetical protein